MLAELPGQTTPARGERADAARNRQRILDAARRLVAAQGAPNVSVDRVAAAAGVGKGTVFRRFGDRAGLFLALLGEAERELQDGFLRGPPPLGPGAPARDRLIAFLVAYLRLLEENLELVLLAESGRPGTRYRSGAYAAWHQHVSLLLDAGSAAVDAPLAAHLLLAAVDGDLHRFLREAGFGPDQLERALTDLVRRLLPAG